jgi:hypothetical protein
MKNLLLAFAVLFVMGTLAVAQSQNTAAPSSMNGTQSTAVSPSQGDNGAALAQEATHEQTDLNSPNFTHEDIRGTELEKAYQRESVSGWQDPNTTKSAVIAGGGN